MSTATFADLMAKPLLTRDEAALVLGIHRTTLSGWVREGTIRSIKVGGRRYVPTDEIRRLAATAS